MTIHFFSVTYYRAYPSEVLDYQGLALKMASKINEGDLIFVHKKSWVTTPIFYYLKPEKYQLIAENYREEVQRHPHSRVWVIEFVGEPISEEMHAALANYHRQDQVESLRSAGPSYVR
ncbi:MAG: hypothetical protein WKF84_22890 [Pyrinomonadaceae bacterium]